MVYLVTIQAPNNPTPQKGRLEAASKGAAVATLEGEGYKVLSIAPEFAPIIDYKVKGKDVLFNCSKCKALLSDALERAGSQDHCPHCGVGFLTPGEVDLEKQQLATQKNGLERVKKQEAAKIKDQPKYEKVPLAAGSTIMIEKSPKNRLIGVVVLASVLGSVALFMENTHSIMSFAASLWDSIGGAVIFISILVVVGLIVISFAGSVLDEWHPKCPQCNKRDLLLLSTTVTGVNHGTAVVDVVDKIVDPYHRDRLPMEIHRKEQRLYKETHFVRCYRCKSCGNECQISGSNKE